MRTTPIVLVAFLVSPAAVAHGPVHERIDAVTRELAESPDDATLLAKRGTLFMLDEDFRRAASDFERARHIQPDLDGIDNRLADALLQGGDPARARNVATQILVRDAGDADAYMVRARASVALGERARAVDDYSHAIALSKRPSPRHYRERADATDDPGAAVVGLREGIARLGPLASLVEPAIQREHDRGEHEAALRLVEQLPETLRTSPKWLAERGHLLAAANRPLEARTSYHEALAAIDALPASRRDAKARQAIRADIERALAELEAPSAAQPTSPPPAWVFALVLLFGAVLWRFRPSNG